MNFCKVCGKKANLIYIKNEGLDLLCEVCFSRIYPNSKPEAK